jgi:hypothetical protein
MRTGAAGAHAASCGTAPIGRRAAQLGERRVGGRGRHDQHVDLAPQALGVPLQHLHLVLRREQLVGKRRLAAPDDRRDGRVGVGRVGVEECADRGITFGDPRPFVKQARGARERLERHARETGAEGLEHAECARERALGEAVAEKFERLRHAEAQSGDRIDPQHRRQCGAAVRIERIGRRAHACHRPGIVGRQREHRDAVEAATGRHDATRREPALGRLQSGDVAEARRHPAGAGGVGAERKRDLAGRDDIGRAGTRAAADVRRVERVGDRAERRAGADQAGRELVEVGLADHDRAGIDEALHERRVGQRRREREAGAGGGRRQPGDVDVVLHCERHAVERHLVEQRRPAFVQKRVATLGLLQQRCVVEAADPGGRREGRRRVQRARDDAAHRSGAIAQAGANIGEGRRVHGPVPVAWVALSLCIPSCMQELECTRAASVPPLLARACGHRPTGMANCARQTPAASLGTVSPSAPACGTCAAWVDSSTRFTSL